MTKMMLRAFMLVSTLVATSAATCNGVSVTHANARGTGGTATFAADQANASTLIFTCTYGAAGTFATTTYTCHSQAGYFTEQDSPVTCPTEAPTCDGSGVTHANAAVTGGTGAVAVTQAAASTIIFTCTHAATVGGTEQTSTYTCGNSGVFYSTETKLGLDQYLSHQDGKYCYYKVGSTSTYGYPTAAGAPGASKYLDFQTVESCASICETAYPKFWGNRQFFLKKSTGTKWDECCCCDQTKEVKYWPEGTATDRKYKLYTRETQESPAVVCPTSAPAAAATPSPAATPLTKECPEGSVSHAQEDPAKYDKACCTSCKEEDEPSTCAEVQTMISKGGCFDECFAAMKQGSKQEWLQSLKNKETKKAVCTAAEAKDAEEAATASDSSDSNTATPSPAATPAAAATPAPAPAAAAAAADASSTLSTCALTLMVSLFAMAALC